MDTGPPSWNCQAPSSSSWETCKIGSPRRSTATVVNTATLGGSSKGQAGDSGGVGTVRWFGSLVRKTENQRASEEILCLLRAARPGRRAGWLRRGGRGIRLARHVRGGGSRRGGCGVGQLLGAFGLGENRVHTLGVLLACRKGGGGVTVDHAAAFRRRLARPFAWLGQGRPLAQGAREKRCLGGSVARVRDEAPARASPRLINSTGSKAGFSPPLFFVSFVDTSLRPASAYVRG